MHERQDYVEHAAEIFHLEKFAPEQWALLAKILWVASATNGKKLGEYNLESPPVWDSLAAVNGRLHFCTADGRVHCFEAN